MTIEELDQLLAQREDEHLEVKEAKSNIDSEELLDYCAAMANEGGGKIVLGVTNKRPRTVVGTSLFLGEGLERKKHDILNRLRVRVDIHEVLHPNGRVLVIDIPSHPPGTPVERSGGRYLSGSEGSPLSELHQVLPALSITQVQKLLRELKLERRAHCVGRTKGGLWFPGVGPS